MNRLAYFVTEAWRGMWHHRSLTLTAIASLAGALLTIGIFLLFTANAQQALSTLGDRREVIVYLRETAPQVEVEALVARLNGLYGQATYVSKQEAWDEFSKELGGDELLKAVGENPLPASIRLKLRPEFLNFRSMERIADAMTGEPVVEEVRFGGEWVRRLDQFAQGLATINFAVGVLVALGVLIVVANTIRLTVVARRELLRIMALVGASPGFLRAPLVFEGVLVATLAALLALGLLAAAWAALDGRPIALVFLPWRWMLAFVGAAAFLGFSGSMLALVTVSRKH
ncbi:MAG: ABC transporter permease [Candidatus Eisenbacteria bacterium]